MGWQQMLVVYVCLKAKKLRSLGVQGRPSSLYLLAWHLHSVLRVGALTPASLSTGSWGLES